MTNQNQNTQSTMQPGKRPDEHARNQQGQTEQRGGTQHQPDAAQRGQQPGQQPGQQGQAGAGGNPQPGQRPDETARRG